MNLRPEVFGVLVREQRVCEIAIVRLKERLVPLEQKYGWTTDRFLEMFDAGEIGDDQTYFLWYSLAESVKDWQKTRDGLEELLTIPELMSA